MEALEACHHKVMNSRGVMARADAQLAFWIRQHVHLVPAEVSRGESSMALLILWEVDHGQNFPTQAENTPASRLLGFTRRLKRQVSADAELREWLVCKDLQLSLSPGLPPSHRDAD